MERENADGGASNSFIQNDKEEDYYYTTPISAQMSHSENKTRSIGEGRSASSSPSIKNMQYSNLQNRVRQLQPENSRYGISDKLFSGIIYSFKLIQFYIIIVNYNCRIDKISNSANRVKNSPESIKNRNYSDALDSINQAQNDLKLQSPSILQRTQQQLNEQQHNMNGRAG